MSSTIAATAHFSVEGKDYAELERRAHEQAFKFWGAKPFALELVAVPRRVTMSGDLADWRADVTCRGLDDR